MAQPNLEQLLEAGVHFGHQTRRWNPKMRRFIFAERNGIHIIDLQKTLRQLELAQKLAREVILRGDNVLFVCTKRQLVNIVKSEAERCGAMYVTERWLGGLLTNFQTVKKQVRRLKELEAGSEAGGDFENYTKKEQLMMSRQRDKLSKNLAGIKNLTRLPGLMFVIDSKKERIAVNEANKLGIPLIALVDTNADPDLITRLQAELRGRPGRELDDALGAPHKPHHSPPRGQPRVDLLHALLAVEEHAIDCKPHEDHGHAATLARVDPHPASRWQGAAEHEADAAAENGPGDIQLFGQHFAGAFMNGSGTRHLDGVA